MTRLAPVLQDPVNPESASIMVNSPLQAGWRVEGNKLYVFVVNPTGQPRKAQSIRVAPSFRISSCQEFETARQLPIENSQWQDDFAPLDVKIYAAE
ncbi:MAG: hypothetical protein KF851_05760 [Pirellulaceae bacterium]|nr:hypothetical protein [Pirellulaceae bacterium]